jgi:hypothetical protein
MSKPETHLYRKGVKKHDDEISYVGNTWKGKRIYVITIYKGGGWFAYGIYIGSTKQEGRVEVGTRRLRDIEKRVNIYKDINYEH